MPHWLGWRDDIDTMNRYYPELNPLLIGSGSDVVTPMVIDWSNALRAEEVPIAKLWYDPAVSLLGDGPNKRGMVINLKGLSVNSFSSR